VWLYTLFSLQGPCNFRSLLLCKNELLLLDPCRLIDLPHLLPLLTTPATHLCWGPTCNLHSTDLLPTPTTHLCWGPLMRWVVGKSWDSAVVINFNIPATQLCWGPSCNLHSSALLTTHASHLCWGSICNLHSIESLTSTHSQPVFTVSTAWLNNCPTSVAHLPLLTSLATLWLYGPFLLGWCCYNSLQDTNKQLDGHVPLIIDFNLPLPPPDSTGFVVNSNTLHNWNLLHKHCLLISPTSFMEVPVHNSLRPPKRAFSTSKLHLQQCLWPSYKMECNH